MHRLADRSLRLSSGLAQRLQSCLAVDTRLETNLLDEVASMQTHVPFNWRHLTLSERIALDKTATSLWNALIRAQWHREEENDLQVQSQGPQIWGLDGDLLRFQKSALSLFSCLKMPRRATGQNQSVGYHPPCLMIELLMASDSARIFKVSLKATSLCLGKQHYLATAQNLYGIDARNIELASMIMEQSALYEKSYFDQYIPNPSRDTKYFDILRVQYLSLRISLVGSRNLEWRPLTKFQAWHQNRLDLAEHLFSQISTACLSMHARSAEMFAEILLEIGSGLLDDMRSDSAVHWLERLHTVIEQQGLVAVSANMGELRLNVMHAYGM
ncbi:MAG: hypothetical protein Q9160_006772 [Pyrenula sp. 1 TL-2023]